MPIRHSIWKVGTDPEPLSEVSLATELLLEEMILKDSSILSDRWMLIGRQVRTRFGKEIDLLALNGDGNLIIIELKRNRTPRDVVAQALDYASWVKDLEPKQISEIYRKFSEGGDLGEAFQDRFDLELDEENLNGSHQIFIVASTLDPATERIVNYLNEMEVPINVIFFQVFQSGSEQFLSRAWLIDPTETEERASGSAGHGERESWNGEYYVSFGHGECRNWEDALKFGFISSGGGVWYTKTLDLLSEGDRIWVNIPKNGYVGVGRVKGPPTSVHEFKVPGESGPRDFLDVAQASYNRDKMPDSEEAEYVVPIEWIETRPVSHAISEIGFFGNQNTVCRPRTTKWSFTVERLKEVFGVPESGNNTA